jgi:predicted ester cyclase
MAAAASSQLHVSMTDAAAGEAVVHALVGGDVLALQAMVHPDVVDHSAVPGQPEGWAGLRERAMTLCASVPDSDAPVEVLCVDGDTAMCRVRLTGIPRTGPGASPADLMVVFVLRFQDGLLREIWTSSDLRLPSDASLA